MAMRNNTKGFYTLEAAIFLPFVLLVVLSLGYFMRIDGMWENCIHGAVDESAAAAAKSYGGGASLTVGSKVKSRIMEDVENLDQVEIQELRVMYSDFYADSLTSYKITAKESLQLPLGFQREFTFQSGIKFRGFVGIKNIVSPMGTRGLETQEAQNPVCIFPHSGEKYHSEGCTYVKASVETAALIDSLKRKYAACALCNSGDIPIGSIVFCFKGEDTAYHRGTCGTIKRRTVVIDRSEAVERGYSPCSKCGGG